MDPLKKVTDDLALLGGELSIDRFLEARQAAAPAPQPKAPRQAQPKQPAPRPSRPAAEKPRAETAPDSSVGSDTGKLRLEVEAFMNRDSAEETDDTEVQEFLKERAGFDPSELE